MYEITNRTADPYRTVCYVVCSWADGTRTSGSGVVVGLNDVLTAMHVVFDHTRGGWATQIAISPAADTKPFLVQPLGEFNDWGRLSGRTSDWDRNGDGLVDAAESQWDLAVIGLRSRIGDVTGWVGTSAANMSFSGEMVGYPSRGTGMMGEQVFASASSRYGVFQVDASLGAGASGGPLLQTRSDGHVSVVGVLSGGSSTSSTYAALYGAGTWDWFSATVAGNNDLIGGSGSGTVNSSSSNSSSSNSNGAYNPFPAVDDFSATMATRGVALVGGGVTGQLEKSGDADWFKVVLPVGDFRFEAKGEDSGGGTLGDPVLTLLSGSGVPLAQDDDSGVGMDASLPFSIKAAGTYYLAVSASDFLEAYGIGTYTLRVTPLATGAAALGSAQGTGANDTVDSSVLNDRFDGGAGTDRWVLDGIRADYTLTHTAAATSAAWTLQDRVTGRDGLDTLLATERLVFTDRVVALDLQVSDAAGRAALLLGVAVGPQALQNRALVGALVNYFDAGVTMLEAANWLVDSGLLAQLAGGADNLSFVRHVYLNVVGVLPSTQTTSDLAQYLSTGAFTQASLFQTLAEMPLNQAHVNLVGLQNSGLEYFGV